VVKQLTGTGTGTGLIMKEFGHFFLLLVQTALPVQCQLDEIFVTVDNVGQVYTVDDADNVEKVGDLLQNWRIPVEMSPDPNSKYIAIAASNEGTWSRNNPAGILLSTRSRLFDNNRLLTDDNWKCEEYGSTGNPRTWPGDSDRTDDILDLKDDYADLPHAVELGPNFSFGPWGTVPNIQLGAQWIWFAGYGDDGRFPPNNVICIKELP